MIAETMIARFFGEVLGTFFLMLLGNGVVANVLLKETKGNGSGWIVITWGWGIAVFVGVFTVGPISGAHINPAVTLGLAMAGEFPWLEVPSYMAAQLIGAMVAAWLVFVQYRDHFEITENKDLKLGVFCTAPNIRDYKRNFLSEAIGTLVLVLGVLYLAEPEVGLGSISALPVGLLVFGIGMSLGGTTGYAINPARDFGPRIMHALLPVPEKRDSDWGYSWVPVFGPFAGATVAVLIYLLMPF